MYCKRELFKKCLEGERGEESESECVSKGERVGRLREGEREERERGEGGESECVSNGERETERWREGGRGGGEGERESEREHHLNTPHLF